MDYLTDEGKMPRIKAEILKAYPRLITAKRISFTCPPSGIMRRIPQSFAPQRRRSLIKVNYSDFNLIVKHHVVDTNLEEIYVDSRMNETTGQLFTGTDFYGGCRLTVSRLQLHPL
jgi:hypothetical protein